MSKQLSKIRIIDDSDFLRASRLEKLQMVFLEPRLESMLNNQEYQHWQQVQLAFQLVYKEFSQNRAIKILRAQIAGAERFEVAKRIFDDMAAVYGPVMRRNKDLARAQLVERLWSIGRRLEHGKKLMEAAEVFAMAGKFEGLDKHEPTEFNPEDVTLPELEITNDPKYLNAEYEDVTNQPDDDHAPEEESLFQ